MEYFLCNLADWPDLQIFKYQSIDYIDMHDFWWRVMIWSYEHPGQVSAKFDQVWRYFLHNDKIWAENQIIYWGRMAQGNELIFGIQGWFVNVNHPPKFQLKWIKETSTSFANRNSGQNLQRDIVLKIWIGELGILMEMMKIWIWEAPQINWDFS